MVTLVDLAKREEKLVWKHAHLSAERILNQNRTATRAVFGGIITYQRDSRKRAPRSIVSDARKRPTLCAKKEEYTEYGHDYEKRISRDNFFVTQTTTSASSEMIRKSSEYLRIAPAIVTLRCLTSRAGAVGLEKIALLFANWESKEYKRSTALTEKHEPREAVGVVTHYSNS